MRTSLKNLGLSKHLVGVGAPHNVRLRFFHAFHNNDVDDKIPCWDLLSIISQVLIFNDK